MIESSLTSDVSSLAALAVPGGTQVMVVAGSAVSAAIERALQDRGCTLHAAGSVPEARSPSAAKTFGAVILAEGFEQLDDPIDALRSLATVLDPGGRLIVVADNASSAVNQARLLRGETDESSGDLPPRRYDLGALERVVDRAGLVVTDRLRVADVEAAPSHPEARTRQFVIVAEPATRAVAAVAPTAAEALQTALDAAEAEVTKTAEQRDALERTIDELSEQARAAEILVASLRTEAEDARIELEARADALSERVEEMQRLHADRRHLELDLAVKDEYISEVRAQLLGVLNDLGALRYEHEALLRSRQYRGAALMYRTMRKVPFLHRLVQGTTDRVVPLARRVRPRA